MGSFIKNNKLVSILWGILAILLVVMTMGLINGWGVDKSIPGIYFKPQVVDCNDEAMVNLIYSYYTADVAGDETSLKALFIDPDTLENIKAKNLIIEGYENFTLHCVKGVEANSYVIYAYWTVKFNGIDTPAPGMEAFYMVSENGTNLLQNKLSIEQEDYVQALRESDEVSRLYNIADKNLLEALKDEKLKAFYDHLLETSKTD